jgi:hypothetical protein
MALSQERYIEKAGTAQERQSSAAERVAGQEGGDDHANPRQAGQEPSPGTGANLHRFCQKGDCSFQRDVQEVGNLSRQPAEMAENPIHDRGDPFGNGDRGAVGIVGCPGHDVGVEIEQQNRKDRDRP